MRLIAAITDKNFIDSEVLSAAEPRQTVRTLLFNNEGKVALLYNQKFRLYSFPGGGIEYDEGLEEALKREVLEETGCQCEILKELGYIYENRGQMNYTQKSYYYVTRKIGIEVTPVLTDVEAANGLSCKWYNLEEVKDLLEISAHETMQQKYLQARDLAALEEYLKGNEIRIMSEQN